MNQDLVATLLPILARRLERQFNVFTVMHHGTHEKQLSNVFAWLLDADETHQCGDAFLRIFLEEINRGLDKPLAKGSFSVRQEVNTRSRAHWGRHVPPEPAQDGSDTAGEEGTGEDLVEMGMDIADLVLEGRETVIVVENYYTSSGHGHCYHCYLEFGARGKKRSVVVLLCERENSAELKDNWENARVVTYPTLVERLLRHVENDPAFREKAQYEFISQMHEHFVGGMRVNDDDVVNFIDVLCKTGAARHFGTRRRGDGEDEDKGDAAATNFADHLREEAKRRFEEGRELLRRIKRQLQDYGEGTLKPQVNAALEEQYVGEVSARLQGIYEWTINFYQPDRNPPQLAFQMKFGPSAWYANEKDKNWSPAENSRDPDYSHLFVTCGRQIRQSDVTIRDVLTGFSQEDTRLRDEVLGLIKECSR